MWSVGMMFPRRRLVLRVLGTIAALLFLMMIWFGWKAKRTLDNVDAMRIPQVVLPSATAAAHVPGVVADPPEPTQIPTVVPQADSPVNILLLGTDARPGEEVSRTDAIVLVHLDPRANRVSMLSFPRDLWVKIPGFGQARINSAYPTGERKLGPGYGPALAKATVSQLVGLPIDHFVLINFEGFKTVIDELGGVYIDVPKAIDDPAYPTDDYRTIKIHFDAGRQLLDGEHALIYARTRHADNDFGRNQRQQQVLMAIFDRVREQGLLGQLNNLDEYTGILRDYVRFDMSRSEMLGLASIGPHLQSDDIQRYAIDSTMIANLKPPATFAADPKAVRKIVNQMIDPTIAAAGGEPSGR
jgi:polyisoprenyl-teichoic acid--peptidoglycan teichoic acid transferase